MHNRRTSEPTPIPIETCLTFEDAERDKEFPNRFWFNLPGEWDTSSNNERIVGLRNIYLLKNHRKIEYTIKLRKYSKANYKIAYKEAYGQDPQEGAIDWFYPRFSVVNTVVEKMKTLDATKDSISELSIPVISWIAPDNELKKIYQDFMVICQPYVDSYNSQAPQSKPKFCISSINPNDRDIQMDGSYTDHLDDDDKVYLLQRLNRQSESVQDDYPIPNDPDIIMNNFLQLFYSPRNMTNDDPYFVDIALSTLNSEFKKIMNIDDAAYPNKTNSAFNLSKYSRYHLLYYIWDRKSCKAYSSLASQSNKNYIGNSEVYFNPIKYFILTSTDKRFYVDFYFGRHTSIPVKIPEGESFCIEIQLLQYRKLLYI